MKPYGNGSNPYGDLAIVIKGGRDVNLKDGDQVAFYNEHTLWTGKPCESDFLGYNRPALTPFAYGEVVVDDFYSMVVITKRLDTTEIKPGWRVELFKRVEDVEKEKAAEAQAAKAKK